MAHDHDAHSRTTYERFLEYERSMNAYPRGGHLMNPTPLGFCAFALTLFVYSMYMAGATVPEPTTPSAAMGLGLFYGGLILLIAGILEFRVGNNFHALTFCSYAGFWFGLASLYVNTFNFFGTSGISDTSVQEKCLGVFFLGWTIFTLLMLIASIRSNVALIVFFFFLMTTYILFTAAKFLVTNYDLQRAGGAVGIFTAAVAWFIGFSNLLRKGDNAYFNLPNYSLAPKTRAGMNGEAPIERRGPIV